MDEIQKPCRTPLSRVRVAAPCSAEWRWMRGDDRVRFCGVCAKNVYNLSAMTKQDAEDLIRKTEGELCIRYYRRADGTILTANCPVGLRAIRKKVSKLTTAVASSALSFFANIGVLWWVESKIGTKDMFPVFATLQKETNGFYVGLVAAPHPPGSDSSETNLTDYPTFEYGESLIREKATFKVMPAVIMDRPLNEEESEVVVKIVISITGEVTSALCTNGLSELRQAAEDAAYSWKFQPTFQMGKRVQVESTLTFHFGR